MQAYEQRLVDEKKELDGNHTNLIEFMEGDVYRALPTEEQGLLIVQLTAMNAYSEILERIIELF